MKSASKILLIVLGLVVVAGMGGYVWLRSATIVSDHAILTTCPALGDAAVALPAHIELSRLGSIQVTVDLAYLSRNFEAIMRHRLPPEGGDGEKRLTFRDFAITALPDGTAKATFHVKVDNYKLAPHPLGVLGIGDKKAAAVPLGSVDFDVIVIVTPSIDNAALTTTRSITLSDPRESGLINVFSEALPGSWLLLNEKLRTKEKEINGKPSDQQPIFEAKADPEREAFAGEIFAGQIIVPDHAHFINGTDGLALDAGFVINGGFRNVSKVLEIFRRTHGGTK